MRSVLRSTAGRLCPMWSGSTLYCSQSAWTPVRALRTKAPTHLLGMREIASSAKDDAYGCRMFILLRPCASRTVQELRERLSTVRSWALRSLCTRRSTSAFVRGTLGGRQTGATQASVAGGART